MERDFSGSVAVLFGLDGFRLLAAVEIGGEVEILAETTADVTGCPECGAVARAKDRRPVWVRDLPIAGRPVVLCWHKRIWCCPHALCPRKTWTEQHPAIAPRACLTERARAWAFEQVGTRDAAVSHVADLLGVGWTTVMRLVTTRGNPIIDDPTRLDTVTAVGVDETAFMRACASHSTMYATGIADLTAGRPARLLDVVAGRSGTVLTSWLDQREDARKARVTTASLDPFRGYATALSRELSTAVRVLDPFHVVKLGLTAVDDVRRRVHTDTCGHRGRVGDPLYRIRRVLRRRCDRLTEKAWQRLQNGLDAGPGRRTLRRLVDRARSDVLLQDSRQRRGRSAHRRRPRLPRSGSRPTRPHSHGVANRIPRPFRSSDRLQRADRGIESAGEEHQASRSRIPQLSELPTTPLAQPRTNQK